MSQADLQAAFRQHTPFVPLEMTLCTGEKITVTHPDAILIGKTMTGALIDGSIHLIGNLHVTCIAQATLAAAG